MWFRVSFFAGDFEPLPTKISNEISILCETSRLTLPLGAILS